MFTILLGLYGALLLRFLTDNCPGLVMAFLGSLENISIEIISAIILIIHTDLDPATSWRTAELDWLRIAASHGGVLGGHLLRHLALLPRPVLAPLGGGVALRHVHALHIINSLAVHNIIFNLELFASRTKKIFLIFSDKNI